MPENIVHPAVAALPVGARLVFPWSRDEMTWGDLRELVALGVHLDDGEPIQWDMTDYHQSQGRITEPSGVIIRAEDVD